MTAVWFWSTKGGQGTTTAAVGFALCAGVPVTVLDCGGDVPAVCGAPSSPSVGFHPDDWTCEGIAQTSVALSEQLSVIDMQEMDADIVDTIASLVEGLVVIDAGLLVPPSSNSRRNVLVTKACYLSLRRAAARIDGHRDQVIVMTEPGRALSLDDIASVLGIDPAFVYPMRYDPTVARAIDAGLLMARRPVELERCVRQVQS